MNKRKAKPHLVFYTDSKTYLEQRLDKVIRPEKYIISNLTDRHEHEESESDGK